MPAKVFLIPTVLADGVIAPLPPYLLEAVQQCSVFFVENERTARRYLKLLWKAMVIDDYGWHTMKSGDVAQAANLRQAVRDEKTIGIISEAGCPGIADPGQELVAIAQELKATIVPLVGPNSILLALMGSGMNGQLFQFHGYLPIEPAARVSKIRALESDSRQRGCTQIFIETPYRNNQMLESLLKTCVPHTRICVAADLTAPTETIRTQTVAQWKQDVPQLHKRPAIILLQAGA